MHNLITMNLSAYKSRSSHKNGFTMLEMIVSLGIFGVVAIIAVGALVRIVGLNRQAQSLQAAMNNINYALESMSREMRVGSHFTCTTASTFSGSNLDSLPVCPAGVGRKAILFWSSKTAIDASGNPCPLVIAYWFNDIGSGSNHIWRFSKSQQTSCSGAGNSIGFATAAPLTDEKNVKITSFGVRIDRGPLNYSLATINLIGYAGDRPKDQNEFSIKTAVSQRIAD